MQRLKERILRDGHIVMPDILKVDSFLNHQIDVDLLQDIGREFKRLFDGCGITKILTIESSGIAIACAAAPYFGVPVIFAKKTDSKNLDGAVYHTQVQSYTKSRIFDVIVSKKFLLPEDRILIIDDFLANGKALEGLIDLVAESGATLVGAGIVIEKGFQMGGQRIRGRGIRVESLAIVEAMNESGITFRV